MAADYFEAKDMLGDLGRAVALLHSSHRFPAHRRLNTLHQFFTSPKTKVNKMFKIASRSRNYKLRLRLVSIYQRLEKILEQNIMIAEEVLVNCYNCNLIG